MSCDYLLNGPFTQAARAGDVALLAWYLSHSESCRREGEGVFLHFVYKREIDGVRTFLQAGVDPNAKWYGDEPALSVAAIREAEVIPAHVADSADPFLDPVAVAAELNAERAQPCLEIVLALLAAGASVDGRDRRGRTALMEAAVAGDVAVLSALVRGGAHVNAQTPRGVTALLEAAVHEREGAVRLLLAAGAHAGVCTREGEGLLHRVVAAFTDADERAAGRTSHAVRLSILHVLTDALAWNRRRHGVMAACRRWDEEWDGMVVVPTHAGGVVDGDDASTVAGEWEEGNDTAGGGVEMDDEEGGMPVSPAPPDAGGAC